MSLKILFVGMRWDYKQPERGSSFEYVNLFGALEKMDGVDAELFPFDELERTRGRRGMNEELLRRANEVSYDLIFFFLYELEFEPSTIETLSSLTTTFNWFADDHWRFHTYSKHWARYFTFVGTTDEETLNLYDTHGVGNAILTQWGCNHHFFRPVDTERDIGISFVGQTHGDRRETIDKLRSHGLEVSTWGSGWPAGRLTDEEMISVFSRSRVNLNLGGASQRARAFERLLFLIRPHGKVTLRPTQIRDNARGLAAQARPQIKGRNFEIPGCRTFLLTSDVAGLDRFFQVGSEVETFSSHAELLEKCRYFLHNDREREDIAVSGYRRVIKEHTYERRFEELFRKMGLPRS
jgi:spore maturation protein CgeB